MRISRHLEAVVEGLNINELLKKLEQSGQTLKNVERVSHTCLKFVVLKKHYLKFLEKDFFLCYNVNVKEVPSFFLSLLCLPSRIGIFAGLLISVLSCLFISSFIFDVKVSVSNGNFQLEQEIEAFLKQNNIKDGMKISNFDRKKIENIIFSAFEEVSVVNVKRSGAKLFIEVEPAVVPALVSGPIVAKYDALIEGILVKTGKAKVKKGDTVKRGEVLVEPDENGFSVATIMARVWFESSVTVEAKKIELVRTGKKSQVESLKIFGQMFKSSGKLADYECFEEEIEAEWGFLNFFLPLKIVTITRYELKVAETLEARNIQIEKARHRAEKNTRLKIPFGAEVVLTNFFIREDENFVTVDCFMETLIEI